MATRIEEIEKILATEGLGGALRAMQPHNLCDQTVVNHFLRNLSSKLGELNRTDAAQASFALMAEDPAIACARIYSASLKDRVACASDHGAFIKSESSTEHLGVRELSRLMKTSLLLALDDYKEREMKVHIEDYFGVTPEEVIAKIKNIENNEIAKLVHGRARTLFTQENLATFLGDLAGHICFVYMQNESLADFKTLVAFIAETETQTIAKDFALIALFASLDPHKKTQHVIGVLEELRDERSFKVFLEKFGYLLRFGSWRTDVPTIFSLHSPIQIIYQGAFDGGPGAFTVEAHAARFCDTPLYKKMGPNKCGEVIAWRAIEPRKSMEGEA